jgi:hypothetical protein
MQQIQTQTVPTNIVKYFEFYGFDLLEHSNCDYNYIFKKRHLARFKTLLKNNRAKTFGELENLLKRLEKFGSASSQETFCIIYGDEHGKTKWKERNNLVAFNSSKEGYINRHGVDEGERKWKEYCDRQAFTNTFEYKSSKYGWSIEDFNKYNIARSSTLENFIKRHGVDEGERKWKEYCDRQAFTNTMEYLGERYDEINKQKALTLENFQQKYGYEHGMIEFEKYIQKCTPFYSKISQQFFNELLLGDEFKNTRCFYATLNNEYGVYSKTHKRFFKYDFVCIEHKLCIEFHGDHYHGNPKIYRPDDILKGRGQAGITAKKAWEKDKIKQNVIYIERGYDTIVVWESDYRTNPIQIFQKIQNAIRTN